MNTLAFPLHRLAAAAGLEPSRVQFLRQEFAGLLPSDAGAFDPNAIEVLQQVHSWYFLEHRPAADIRRELGETRRLRIIAVTSGKGGVGKTTVAVNLALALAARGERTVLLDGDLGMANVHVYAGITAPVTLLDVIDGRATFSQAVINGPGGVRLVCGASGVTRLADLDSVHIERIGRELRALVSSSDIAVIDTGAGISAQVMAFLALADEIITVTTPNLAATLDAYGIIKAAHEARLPGSIHLLVNQAEDGAEAETVWQRIAGCAQRFLHFSPGSLGSLRRDPETEHSGISRRPLLIAQPQSENASRLTAIAVRLARPETVEPAPSAAALTAA